MSPSRWLAIFASFGRSSRSASPPAAAAATTAAASAAPATLSGEVAGAGSTAQEAAQEAWTAEFENANSGATITYDAVGSGGGREQFIAGGVAFAGSDAALTEEEGELKKAAAPMRTGAAGRDPGLHLADRDRLQPRRRRIPAALGGNAGGDLQPEDHHLERPGDRQGQPGRRTPGHADHAGQPLGRVGHDPELHRIPLRGRPEGSGPTKSAVTGRSRAARPRRAPPASSKRSPPVTARSATPTPARPANSASPRSRSASKYEEPTPEAAAAVARAVAGSQGRWPRAPYMFPFELDRKTESLGHLPDRPGLVPDRLHEVQLGQRSGLVKGYFEYVISTEGQEAAASQRRLRSALGGADEEDRAGGRRDQGLAG